METVYLGKKHAGGGFHPSPTKSRHIISEKYKTAMRLKFNFSKNGAYNEETSLFMGATLAATKECISTLYRPFFEKSNLNLICILRFCIFHW